jgi:hypothetical protein
MGVGPRGVCTRPEAFGRFDLKPSQRVGAPEQLGFSVPGVAFRATESPSNVAQWRQLQRHGVFATHSNRILFPTPADRIGERCGRIRTRERLGGLLKFYYREAA